MKRTLALAALLGTTATLPAVAGNVEAGLEDPAPMAPIAVEAPAPVRDWTGFSTGLQLGYGNVETDGDAEIEGDGALYGARAYYDYDFGGYVLGGGLQYDGADIELGDDAANIDGVLRAGVRGGADLGNTFLYGTGGYAKAMVEEDEIGDADGYFAGLGVETYVTDNVTLGSELLYHKFDEFDEVDGLEADATTANVSVNYRF